MRHQEKPWTILSDSLRNKGTAFSHREREIFQLHGRLPYHESTLEEQVERRYSNFKMQSTDLARHLFLSALYQRNEVLFYRLISDHVTEMVPYLYTPTVGDVAAHFSALYAAPRGLYLAYPHRHLLDQIFDSLTGAEIDVMVVTDGQRILGLGDLGVGGMAIAVGKLILYTLFGGIHPAKTLPIMLDVGTDNPALLNDPLYLGWRHPRINGKEYDDFIEAFVQVVQKRYPRVLLQWEDFGNQHARLLLNRYQKRICSFNDDIQGTAAVVLAALLSSGKLSSRKLYEERIIVVGGGSAGMGICHYLVGAMQEMGVSEKEALQSIYVVDIQGVVHTALKDIPDHQKRFARDVKEIQSWGKNLSHTTLLDVVESVRPTVLIGVSGQYGIFTQQVIKTMSRYVERPMIFPLSNPISKSEAHPADIFSWTQGKGIVATGSPFQDIHYDRRAIPVSQCNNIYIYPGVGLGVVACHCQQVSEKMFYRAAEILSRYSPLLKGEEALFPPLENLRDISKGIALEVMRVAEEEGFSPTTDQQSKEEMAERVMWNPVYTPFT